MMEPEQQELWDKQLEALGQGKIACRIHLARRFTEEYPLNYPGLISLGIALYEISRFSESRAVLKKAEVLCHEELLDWIFRERGNLYDRKGNHSRAEFWYRKAVQSSLSTRNLTLLGACLARRGKAAEAKQNYRKAIEVASSVPAMAYYNLGLALRAEEKYEEAQECLEKSLDLDPEYSEAEKACLDLKRLLVISAEPLKGTERPRQRELRDERDEDEPTCCLLQSKQYAHDYPENFVNWIKLGDALRVLSRFRESRAALRKAESLCPNKHLDWVFIFVGCLYREKGNYVRAEIWYRKAVERRATTGNIIMLGACLARQGKYKEAKEVHRRAIETVPSEPGKLNSWDASLLKKGKFADQEMVQRKVQKLAAAVNAEAYFNLGLVLRAEERYEEALEYMEKALGLDPENSGLEEARLDLVEVLALIALR